MYVIHDCQNSTGSWKANKLSEIKYFAEFVLMSGSTKWINFKKESVVVSPCERYEAEKTDGRSLRDIPFVEM